MATLDVDAYIVETLMPDLVGHDRHPSAFLVYLFLWYHTHGGRLPGAALSLQVIAEGTGLSKRAVQAAVRALVRRRLISVSRAGRTAIPDYTVHRPWVRRGRAQ